MEYTKSMIRDSKKRIGYLMAKIIEWMPKVGDDMFAAGIVTEKLEDLCSELVPLKPYIIDNDLHALATEIDTLVAPIMDMNCNSLQHALTDNLVYKAQDIVKDLQDWISEYEEEHPVQPNRPVNNPTAKDFLTLFNALSRDCLMYIENKYDLGYKENPNVKTVLSPYMQHQIHEVIPNRITSGFNEGILTLANLNKVMEEIESNLDNCESLEVLERYVVRLLEPFRAVSDKMTMFQNENFEKQRAQIEEEMKKLGTPENCLIDLLFIMTKYANKLYAALIQRGFDLRRFQDEVEIYLKKEWTWFDIAPYVGGRKRAQHFMEQANEHITTKPDTSIEVLSNTSLENRPYTPVVNQPENHMIINGKIINALPEIYDYLLEDKVIGISLSKVDFITYISKGVLSSMKEEDKDSSWVKKIAKMKEFIKCIKTCFDKNWYSSVCASAGLTERQIQQYNTDKTADLGQKIIDILKKYEVK